MKTMDICQNTRIEPIAPLENATGQVARSFKANFIEPGLVHYGDVGTVFVKKDALDKMLESFKGRAVFNNEHRENRHDDFTGGHAEGMVTKVWYEPSDGWYWCEFMTADPETIRNCESGTYSVSCAYNVKTWKGAGGVHNNIPYSDEVLAGEYVHLAIVPNPRYEGARIIYNSNGGNMKLAFWKKEEKSEVRNAASEIDAATATIEIDGKPVKVMEMVELWNVSQSKISDDDHIEIAGKRVSIRDLKANFVAANAKNEGDDKKKTDEKDCPSCDGDGKVGPDDKKCPKCDGDGVVDKAKKDADKKENADPEDDDETKKKKKKDDDDEKEKDTDKERKNALDVEAKDKEIRNAAERARGKDGFGRLKNAAADRNAGFEAPNLMTPEQRVEEGNRRYGSAK